MLLFPCPSPLSPADFPFLKPPSPSSRVLLLLFSLLPILVLSQGPHTEQQILLKIKQQWGNHLRMQSWNSNTPQCHWFGIECNSGKSVTGINLNVQNIEGKIPPSICDLKNLTFLDLGNNNITGNFPTVLYNCTKLQTLVLSSNNFVGNLPNDINKLSPDLQNLDLSVNWFTGDIPSSLGNLTSLENLTLAFNTFSGMSLPKEFWMLKKIISLDISNSQISGTIPSSVANWTNLETFKASGNLFWGNIPLEFTALTSLTTLLLDGNQFSRLPSSILSWKSMSTLHLARNNLSGPLPAAIGSLTHLQDLDLSYNQLSGLLPSEITACASLVSLNLARNNLSGPLWAGLGSLPKLYSLDLSYNQLSGYLPAEIVLSTSLGTLNLARNNLFGPLPAALASLTCLYHLDLSCNQLSGYVPSRIISWTSLESLNLSGNKLSGSLPAALGPLPNISDLNLSHNQLLGQVPPELAQLNLDFLNLDLSSNNLSGKIPHEFENTRFNLSFLNNANMCSDKHISNLPLCSSSQHIYLPLFIVFGATIFLVVMYFTFFRVYMARQQESGEHQAWELKKYHRVNFSETNILSGLTDSNMIGSGGSGKVYRIILNDLGDKVAVKKIWSGRKLKDALEKQFLTEIEILGTFRHANIVKLLCCISCAQVKLLVYEYMEKQSLDKWLGRRKEADEQSLNIPDPDIVLDWPTRLKVAVGAAKALCYLHHDCSPPIIHRDVKTSNILLDSEFNAKLADFGLAKLTITTGELQTASVVAGSFGYIAPEYWRTQRLNEKIDIYSFGVVLLELATGKDPCTGNDHLNLADWSWQQHSEEYLIIGALDKNIADSANMEQMVNVFKLGLMCTSRMPNSRPPMKRVLQLLTLFSHNDNHGLAQTVNEE